MILGWILLAIAVALIAPLALQLRGHLAEASRLARRRTSARLPWGLRRLNPVVPRSFRCASVTRPTSVAH